MRNTTSARRVYLMIYGFLFSLNLGALFYWANLPTSGWERYALLPVFLAIGFSIPTLARSVARLCPDFQSEKTNEEIAFDENYFPAIIAPCRVQMFSISMQESSNQWVRKAGVFLLPLLLAALFASALVLAGLMWFLIWAFYEFKHLGMANPFPLSLLFAALGFLTVNIIFILALAAFFWKWRNFRITIVSLDARGLSCLSFPNMRRPRLFAWHEIATCRLIVDRNSAGEDKTRIEIFNAAKKKLRVVRCGYVIPEEREALFAQLRYIAKK